jgi:hypothetical protein
MLSEVKEKLRTASDASVLEQPWPCAVTAADSLAVWV